MAKTKEAGPIDEDTREHLSQVKKGMPRRFVMLCKGPQIVSLVLYKKGNVDKYKKQAKLSGSGEAYFGVVDGQGMDLTFKLAQADGFKAEPTRSAVVKDFLAEHAEITCKPSFEIVAAHGPVLHPDNPLHARLIKAQAATKTAAQTHPDRAAELNTLASDTAKLFDQDRDAEGEPKLLALEKLLGRLSATATPPPATPPVPTPPPPPPAQPSAPTGPAVEAFTARFTALKPDLAKAIGLGTPESLEIKELGGKIATQARKGEYAAALEALGDLEGRIKKALSAPRPTPPPTTPPSPESDVDLAQLWKDRTATLPVDLKKLQELKAPELPEIVKLTKSASDLVKLGNYQQAFVILDQAEPLLAKAMGAARVAAIPDEILREANRLWLAARGEALGKIEFIQQAIQDEIEEDPDDEEEGAKGAAGNKQLTERMNRLDESLQKTLEAALAATGQQRAKLRDEARGIVSEYQKFVATDPIMLALDNSDFVNVSVQKPLATALADLAKQLA